MIYKPGEFRCERSIWAPRGKTDMCSRKATRGRMRDRKLLCTYHDTFHGPGWKLGKR
jgi:hypothetical protein